MLSKQRVSLDIVRTKHSKKYFLIHLLVYIVFILISIAIIFTLSPIYPLFVISPMVWLIGLGEHFTVYRMKSRDVYPRAKRGFYYNLAALIGSLPLLILSFYGFYLIPIWAIILVIHYVSYHIAGTESRGKDVGNILVKNFNGFSEESLRIIALKKVRFRLSLQIHFGLFISFIIIMNLTNFLPSVHVDLFFYIIYVSIWFIILSEHGTAYLIYARGVYPKVKRGYYYNLIAFLTSIPFQCTTMLVIIMGPIWGIAVLIHYITYRILSRKSRIKEGIKKTHLQRLVEKEMEKMKSLM